MPITWNSCDSLRNVFASPGRSPAASGNRRLHRRRDIIRTLVQRIEIGREAIQIVFRRDAERTRLRVPGNVYTGVVRGLGGAEQPGRKFLTLDVYYGTVTCSERSQTRRAC
jgi:hypothetical protein